MEDNTNSIAVIGMACRFPGADNYNELWENLIAGRESINFFDKKLALTAGVPEESINHPNYVPAFGSIKDKEMFDWDFFNLSKEEAEIIDPQHRLFVQTTYNAFEDAGYTPKNFNGLVGVFAGCGMTLYAFSNLLLNEDVFHRAGPNNLLFGNDKDFLTLRTSYLLDLKGPSIAVQNSCATSLSSIHIACQNLLLGECDLAIAGGSSVSASDYYGYIHHPGGGFSSDGHCRAFDEKADGLVISDGVGVVVLRRLDEALKENDHIYAVILSSSISNDGNVKFSFTAPSIHGQFAAISESIAIADINPEIISYVEAHGSGTNIGDPIEITALSKAFNKYTNKKQYCAVGSIKSNIGHTNASAGIAGFIKTCLCLYYKKIPKSINFKRPNPKLGIQKTPFYINDSTIDWPDNKNPRRAGVNSFGIGGTNAHIILEEHPTASKVSFVNKRKVLIFPLSSKYSKGLIKSKINLLNYFKQQTVNISDASFTLQTGRDHFKFRSCLIASSQEAIIEILEKNINPFYDKNLFKKKMIYLNLSGDFSDLINVQFFSDLMKFEPVFTKKFHRYLELPFINIDYTKFSVENAIKSKDANLISLVILIAFFDFLDDLFIKPKFIYYTESLKNLVLYLSNKIDLSLLIDNYKNKRSIQDSASASDQNLHIVLDDQSPKGFYFGLMDRPSNKIKEHIYTFKEYYNFAYFLSKIWESGFDINWKELYVQGKNYKIPLPTYEFKKNKCWIESKKPIEFKDFVFGV